jgi:hypothetical protein
MKTSSTSRTIYLTPAWKIDAHHLDEAAAILQARAKRKHSILLRAFCGLLHAQADAIRREHGGSA